LRILFLTQIVPYPPNAGPRIKTWNVLRYLVERGHQVVLASFIRPEEQQYLPVLEAMCAQVFTVPIRRSRFADIFHWLRSNFTGRPFLVERDNLVEMHTLIRRQVSNGKFDLVQADQLTMAQYGLTAADAAPKNNRPKIVFDAHNATWMILERMMKSTSAFLRPILKLELARLIHYEGLLIEYFDHTLAVTEIDRQAFLKVTNPKVAPEKISVTPIAVDTVELAPVKLKNGSRNILTLGSLQYPPNADGIRWFLREVFPLVRQSVTGVSLTIIGKKPPPDFYTLAEPYGGDVKITGYVDDLLPYYQEAAMIVVPVLAGGGMRVRILEAFSRALPVVTTTIGLEGIDAVPEHDVLVENSPESFACAVVGLLNDPAQQAALATNSRYLAETQYDWRVVLKQMDTLYQG